MTQVFVNLLKNAAYASPAGSAVEISGFTDSEFALVRIRDYGSGIEKEQHGQLFEPFFTTKPVGEGTGLGLPLVYSMLSSHGGKISLNTDIQDGACFEISLPLASEITTAANARDYT